MGSKSVKFGVGYSSESSYIYICIYVYMCVCVYIYIYIYIANPLHSLTTALTASLTASLTYLPTDLLNATNPLEKAQRAFSTSRSFVAASESAGE